MSYIKKEPLLQNAKELQGKVFGAPLIVRTIENAPEEDVVEVRHGEWIPQWEGARLVKCSVCGYEYCDLIECTDYCGNCGAKMDGDRRTNND